VDDEEPLVELASRTLADLGYVPIGFTSSTAALAAFRADPHRFDALITDERMPEMSGSALIREVRGLRGSIPIVLMSGYLAATPRKAQESDLVDVPGMASAAASAIGADEVLQKPLSARDLAASVARVLPLHRLGER
jgi:CheY-like chemotaxis protein